jgi:hypothetical protein
MRRVPLLLEPGWRSSTRILSACPRMDVLKEKLPECGRPMRDMTDEGDLLALLALAVVVDVVEVQSKPIVRAGDIEGT